MELESKEYQVKKALALGLPCMAFCLYMANIGKSASLIVFLRALVFFYLTVYVFVGKPSEILFAGNSQKESILDLLTD